MPERELERLRRENERLLREAQERDRRVAELEEQVADLERQLGLRRQNSVTSSKPPSSDGLAGAQRERGRHRKSSRKPGGQPGHRGYCRPPVPEARVDATSELRPQSCRGCRRDLAGVAAEAGFRRHQVTELPPVRAHITEFRCRRVTCPRCGAVTQAELPESVKGQFGPELTGLMAWLTAECRLPRRVTLEVLSQVLDIPLSLGGAQKAWEEASEAVATPCAELARELAKQPVINSDETGFRTNGDKRWLWALVARTFVCYRIAASRGAEVLVELLGEAFAGVLCSDRCPTYTKYHKGEAQFCWAHFKRNLLGAQDLAKTAETERFCRDALAIHARLFRLWRKFRGEPGAGKPGSEPMTRRELVEKSIPLQKKLFALAERHLDSDERDVRNLATALFVHFPKFFAFVEREGVEPTNNSAERALRCAVQWRKTSFGCRSATGELAVARMLTVTRTCKMRNRKPLAYLAEAIRARREGRPAPSLLENRATP